MTPAFRRRRLAPLTVLAVLPLFAACGEGGGPAGTAVDVTIVPTTMDVATRQVTTAVVRGTRVTAESYAATLGGTAFTAERVNDSTLAYVVPAVAAGQHQLTVTVDKSSVTAPLRVAVTPAIADPAAYIADMRALVSERIAAAEQTVTRMAGGAVSVNQGAFSLDIALAQASLDSAGIAFAALSPAEQQEAAQLVQATLGSFPSASSGSSFGSSPGVALRRTARAMRAPVPGPDYCETPLLLTIEETEVCRDAREADLRNSQVADCEAEAAAAASRRLPARAILFLVRFLKGCHLASLTQFSAETWEAVQWPTVPDLDEVVTELLDPSAAVSPSMTLAAQSSSALAAEFPSASAPAAIAFVPGVPRLIQPTVRFRPMVASDVGKVPAATQTAALLTSLAARWDLLNRVVGGVLGQAPATMERVTAATPRKMSYSATRLRLGAVSPATVRGTASVVNGRWSLTFDTDDKSKPTPFTFDVIYVGGKYGSDTARVSAVLGDSLAIYESAILGMWTRTYLIDGESHPVDFRAQGKVAAHIVPLSVHPHGGMYCRTGTRVGDKCEIYTPWRVYRENGRYYLLDGTAADYGTRDPLTIPVTGFTNYFQGTAQFRFTKH